MSFVYPEVLWALSAILIPILIHLFNLKRPKKVFFSNIRFLKSIEEKSSRKVKFKHWIILASRILFIVCLVLAFCKPYFPSENQNKDDSSNYMFYLDNSLSMSVNYDGSLNLFEKSIIELESIINKLPRNAAINILTNSFSGESMIFPSMPA